jgi:hypothetical protein
MKNPRYETLSQLSNEQQEQQMNRLTSVNIRSTKHLHHDLAERNLRNYQLQHLSKPFYIRWFYCIKQTIWGM